MSELGIHWLPIAAGGLVFGIAVGIGATLGWQSLPAAKAAEETGGPGGFGMPVEIERAVSAAVDVEYQTLGALRSPERVVLRPVERGRITGIHFADGALVSAGDLLIELEAAHQRAALAVATAERDEAQRLRELAAGLLERNAVTEDTLLRRDSELAAAEARVSEAQAELDDRLVRAPFSGQVTRRAVSLGDIVGLDDHIAELIATESMRVSTAIPERYLGSLNREISLRASTPALPGHAFDGVVTYISPEVDSANRSIAVEATIDNADGLLRHGQSVDVTAIVSTLPDSLSIPEEAVRFQGNRITVFIVVDGQAQPRSVSLGPRGHGRVVVTSGLAAGDQVVVEGHEMLRPGVPVTIINPPADLGAPTSSDAAGSDTAGSGADDGQSSDSASTHQRRDQAGTRELSPGLARKTAKPSDHNTEQS